MKTKSLLLSAIAMVVAMNVFTGCKGHNEPDSPSIIDAICDMYGKSLSKAISIAKSNGFSYVDQRDDCAEAYEKEPSETEIPSTQLVMCAEDDSVVELGYMIYSKGKDNTGKIADFGKAIGETRKIDGNILKFKEGDIEDSHYRDFNSFIEALASGLASDEEAEGYWGADNTKVELEFYAEYGEEGDTYINIYISTDM